MSGDDSSTSATVAVLGVIAVALLGVGLAPGMAAATGITTATGVDGTTRPVPETGAVADYPTPSEVCQDVGDEVVAVSSTGGTYGAGASLAVFPGTKLHLVRCSGGEATQVKSAWKFVAPSGVAVSTIDESAYAVEIEPGATGKEISVEERTELSPAPGPTITVTAGATAVADVGDRRVRFGSREAAVRYERAEDEYLAERNRLRERTAQLDNRTEAVSSGEPVRNETKEILETLRGTEELVESRRNATSALFAAAMRGNEAAVATMRALRSDEAETRREIRDSVDAYEAALGTRERGAVGGIVTNFLAAALGGLVLGGVGGWAFTRRRLEAVRRERQYSASATYGLKQMGPPMVVGGLLVIAAVGLLVATGVLDGLLAAVVP